MREEGKGAVLAGAEARNTDEIGTAGQLLHQARIQAIASIIILDDELAGVVEELDEGVVGPGEINRDLPPIDLQNIEIDRLAGGP